MDLSEERKTTTSKTEIKQTSVGRKLKMKELGSQQALGIKVSKQFTSYLVKVGLTVKVADTVFFVSSNK